eukprot:CAMPEP_0202972330 /NCGR_PEP_ID=MMETSP1396-20130829/35480_1 /ASSEMBLY_ACC=CAM_ASM_000872 /TAXON_ID= /ORGANISM="Pseudokeronopsis sp., Strain Brazil" /LENGTH=44 /DNA_ID= /DNA_START= /DNA_END= /DNA_ORIENTATION=
MPEYFAIAELDKAVSEDDFRTYSDKMKKVKDRVYDRFNRDVFNL